MYMCVYVCMYIYICIYIYIYNVYIYIYIYTCRCSSSTRGAWTASTTSSTSWASGGMSLAACLLALLAAPNLMSFNVGWIIDPVDPKGGL